MVASVSEGGKGREYRVFDRLGEEGDGTGAWHLGDAVDVSDEYLPKLP